MKKVSDYRQYADECRALATAMDGEQREQLLQMAATWDALADDREAIVAGERASSVEDS